MAEVLCGIYEETEQGLGKSAGGVNELHLVEASGQEQQDTSKLGQGLRRRKLFEDMTGDRERKCSRVQTQDPALRRAHGEEGGGEMDIVEGFLDESAIEGRRGRGGVLEKVKSILQEVEERGMEGVEGEEDNEEGREWTEVSGKGKWKGKKGSERKGSL